MSFIIHRILASRQDATIVIDGASQPLVVEADSAVQWVVSGVAADETVEVMIAGTRVSELGPFTFSRSESGSVLVRGASGFGGVFSYTLEIYQIAGALSSAKAVARSATATLEIVPGLELGRRGQNILVTYDPGSNLLLVDQHHTRFVSGDPILFEFYLPAKLFADAWLPSIVFAGANDATPAGRYGPFASLSVVDGANVVGAGDGALRRFLVASGQSGLKGAFNYQVLVRSAGGTQVVSSPDPVLDNDGEVVCPGC